MVQTFALALPLLLAGVFVASAAGKIRTPDDVTGWTALGVPKLLRRRWLIRLHPWLELILAGALMALGGLLGVVAAGVAVVLMVAYLVLVVRALRSVPDALCACFGSPRPVTRLTVARNIWLTALALATTSVISTGQLLGGAVVAAVSNWDWIVALAVAAITSGLVLWRDVAAAPPSRAQPMLADASPNTEDYVRARTPAVPITLGDGTTTNLRVLARQRPQLLLAVSETCSSCQPVIDSVGRWRNLLPEVDVRLLVTRLPENSALTSTQPPLTLHDPLGDVRASIAEWRAPTAILLGVDGMLAGGPVSGHPAIEALIGEIRTSLDEMIPQGI